MQVESGSNISLRKKRSGIGVLTTLLFLISILFLALWQRQAILDWYALRNYDPTPPISNLASAATMTDSARKVFYVNHPKLVGRSSFNKFCPDNGGEQTIVLGCYYSQQRGIYVFDIAEARLEGVEQVTAAHEMLHAAYDRLSDSERSRVDSLLEDYFKTKLTDKRIKEVIDSYRKTEPNDLVNEMHSIFGTEISSLPDELEEYYTRYFENRSRLVAYADAYQNEFISRRNQIASYDAELTNLKPEIDTLKSELEAQGASLERQQQELGTIAAAGNTDEFNSRVSRFNQQVEAYNSAVANLRSMVGQYNQIVDKRNEIALEEQELSEALDSSELTPETRR